MQIGNGVRMGRGCFVTASDGELVLHDDLALSMSLLNSGRYGRERWRPFDLACDGGWGVSNLDFADRQRKAGR